MKKNLLFLLSVMLFSSSMLFAAKPIFEVSFNGTAVAETARGGAKKPFDSGYNYEQYIQGMKGGKAARIGLWENQQRPATLIREDRKYFYKYQANNIYNINSGSMSFWLKPEDWDGTDAGPVRVFVSLRGAKHAILFSKMVGKPKLLLYSKADLTTSSHNANNVLLHDISNWKKGQWHHIVISWTEKSMSLYIDGQRAAFGSRRAFTHPLNELCIGYSSIWDVSSQKSMTAISDFKIFDAPLRPEEIEMAWRTQGDSLTKAAEASITAGYATAVPDGVIKPDEYAFTGTGFYETGVGQYSRFQTTYHLARDEKNLYVGWESPKPGNGKLLSLSTIRDEKVWEDDVVELHIITKNKTKYQFIFNSVGAIYDSRSGSTSWNCSEMKLANGETKENWVCETAIPLKELGVKDGEEISDWKVNICRSFQSPSRITTCIAPAARMIGYADQARYYTLSFSKDAPRTSLTSIGDLNNYKLDFKASVKQAGAKCILNAPATKLQKRTIANGEEFWANTPNLSNKGKVEIHLQDKTGSTLYQSTYKIPDLVEFSLLYSYTDIPKKLFKFACNSMMAPDKRGVLKVKVMQGKEIFMEKDFTMTDPNPDYEVGMDISKWKPGSYLIFVSHDNGRGLVKKMTEEWLRIPTDPPEFENYPARVKYEVPQPWTPLVFKDSTISSDSSKYLLGKNSLFFEQITSLNRPMLTGPIAVNVDGNTQAKNVKSVLLKNDGVEANIKTTGSIGNVAFTVESRIEFDGLVHLAVTYAPADGKQVDLSKMEIVIPFDAVVGKFVNGMSRGTTGRMQDKPWMLNLFRQFTFWLGDEDIGINWLAKDMKGWHCKDMSKSLVITTAEKTRNVTFLVVDTPLKLTEPRTIKFALMATPGRKLIDKFSNINYHEHLMFRGGHVSRFFNYYDPKFLWQVRPGNANEFDYNTITGTSPHSEDWNYWGVQWKMGRKIGVYDEDYPVHSIPERNLRHYVHACLNSETFQKYKWMWLDKFINYKPFDIHNIYFDLAKCDPCDSLDHDCGWTDDFGRPQCSFPWYELRQQMRFARQCLLERNPKGRISMHTGDQRIQPIMAFVDASVGGEDFVSEVGNRGNYYDVLSPDVLASYSLPLGLTAKCYFIPQFDRALTFVAPGKKWEPFKPESIRARRHLIAYLIMHNYGCFGAPWDKEDCDNLFKAIDWTVDTEFLPYWKPDYPVRNNKELFADKLYSSTYTSGKKAMIATLNDTDKTVTVTLDVNFQRLLKLTDPAKITNFFNKEKKVTSKNGKITLTYGPREAIFLICE